MIMNTKERVLETNMTGAGSFTIKASAKAFEILSSGLYSDKIRAVVRELSCNALDSHTAAGKSETPIEVHLPNVFEPYFAVKDFGLGLSKDGVLNLYTTYFESTKTESNDQIGALGLGSKSPFSYTDSFTVVSNYNGVQSTYAAYIGSNGEPSIQPLSEVETEECNGVTVQFPVKKEDFDQFIDRAKLVYRPFKVKPNVVGVDNFEIKSRGSIIDSGNGWVMYENGYYNKNINAIQGNIEYPLDNFSISPDTDAQKFVLSQDIDIEFGLGLLDIAASRESLGYDEITKSNIKERLEEVFKEITANINERISGCETLWDACCVAQDAKRIYKNSNYLNLDLKWNDKEIVNSFALDRMNVVKYEYSNRLASKISRTEVSSWFNVDSSIEFVYNDLNNKNKGISRVRANVVDKKTTYVLINDKRVLDLIGNPKYSNISDLDDLSPLETTVNKGARAGKYFKRYYHTTTSSWQWDNLFTTIDRINTDDIVYYLPVTGKTCDYDAHTLVEVALYLGIIKSPEHLVGVQSRFSESNKFKEINDVEFIDLSEKLDNVMTEMKQNKLFLGMLKDTKFYMGLDENQSRKMKKLIDVLKKDFNLLLPGFAKEVLTEYINVSDYVNAHRMNAYVFRFFNTRLVIEDTIIFDSDKIEDEISKRYPMIRIVDQWNLDNRANDISYVAQYINLVESTSN